MLSVVSDACYSTPCWNGGTCEPSRGTHFWCYCRHGYSGQFCDIDTNPDRNMTSKMSEMQLSSILIVAIVAFSIIILCVIHHVCRHFRSHALHVQDSPGRLPRVRLPLPRLIPRGDLPIISGRVFASQCACDTEEGGINPDTCDITSSAFSFECDFPPSYVDAVSEATEKMGNLPDYDEVVSEFEPTSRTQQSRPLQNNVTCN
ncbi:hypothetical protein BaRGS_00037569 [Batillaria attramentaria]|uniref:EGF-like domain-containing protein n=1 Tax=Batillaria attramentaria TaxID=370345 RepID=A0ABD0J945_9CAEN